MGLLFSTALGLTDNSGWRQSPIDAVISGQFGMLARPNALWRLMP
jgi:hypothetical protein